MSPVLMNRVLIFGPQKKQERGIKKSDVENSAENWREPQEWLIVIIIITVIYTDDNSRCLF